MCKNLMIAGIKPDVSKKLLWDFLMAATPFMTTNDKDGLGYAAQGARGLWGERWLRPDDAWKYRKEWSDEDEAIKVNFNGTLVAEPRFNKFGLADPGNTHAVLLHARMATCEKCLVNVHPFVRGKTALIHNGVIRNDQMLTKLTSSCDSECILNEYVESSVTADPDKIKEVTRQLRGYYACGVLTEDDAGGQYLDIFRSNTANLFAYHVKELDAVVFCTSSEIIRNAAKEMGFHLGNTFKFKDEEMIRIDSRTGKLVSQHKFWAQSDYTTHHNGGGYYGRPEYNPSPVERTLVTGLNPTAPTVIEKDSLLKIVSNSTQAAIEEARATGTKSLGKQCGNAVTDEDFNDPFYYQGEGYYPM